MGNVISWIESGSDIFYLTEDEINSPRGKELFNSKKERDLDETAIIDYFDLKHTAKAWVEPHNAYLWSKDLPQKIKDSWNSGKLDFLLEDLVVKDPKCDGYSYFNSDSLDFILKSAPASFYLWALKNRFTDRKGNFSYKEMAKCEDELLEIAAKLASKDFSGLQEASVGKTIFREMGYILANDLEKMKKDENWGTRQMGYYLTKDFTGMEQDESNLLREIGHLANKNFAGLIESDKPLFRMAGYAKGNLDFEAMKARENFWETSVLEVIASDDFEMMKEKFREWGVWDLDIIACLKTNDFEYLKKKSSWDDRALGYILSQDWKGLAKDEKAHDWRFLGSYHTKNFNWAKREGNQDIQKLGLILSNYLPNVQRPVMV